MPMKARNSATDTIAARKRREEVMPLLPLRRRAGEWVGTRSRGTLVRRTEHAVSPPHHDARRGVDLSPQAGTTVTRRAAGIAHVAFLILKLAR